jgi:hypothetical protein
MKTLVMIAAAIAAFGLGCAAAFAAGADKPSDPGGGNDAQVCPAGDSGKIDVSGGSSLTVTAPDGKLISGYCVKAGSANQELGPEFVAVEPPQKTVTITHSSGKDISHYSLTYVDEGQPTETTPTETTPTETTPTETTPTDTTPTDTTPTDTTPTDTTPTDSTPTETTPTETTPTETTETETTPSTTDEQPPAQEPGVFTPPSRQEGKPESDVSVAGETATSPTKEPQLAPLTP